MERKNAYAENALKEFLQKKKSQGIEVDEKMLIGDANTVLELNRYSDEYTSIKRKHLIPSGVNFGRVDADGVPAERNSRTRAGTARQDAGGVGRRDKAAGP